jgi:DNA-binding response OmpR family regulator
VNPAQRVALVVDDEPAIRRWLGEALDALGYVVIAADDVASAKRSLTGMRPDVVMLDLGLGVESGLDVLRFIRRHPVLHDLPVLILTGIAQFTEAEEEAIRRLRAFIFYKPSTIEEIKATLERVVPLQPPS